MRSGVIISIVALLATLAAVEGRAGSPAARTVTCEEIIGSARDGHSAGYRVVLGAVSVPPAYLAQVVRTGPPSFPWWRKAGVLVRAGSGPVTISVPRRSRADVAIIWGNAGGQSAVLRFPRCRSTLGAWNAWAGGFFVRRPACVPLEISVGTRRAVVRFGIGRRCR